MVPLQPNGRPKTSTKFPIACYLRHFKRNHQLTTLVETGTFQGDTVEAMRLDFERIATIEVQPELFQKAQKRFDHYSHIETLFGDSADLIEGLVKELKEPALFWLDAHHSAGVTGRGAEDSSLSKEFDVIIRAINETGLKHVILMDDARDFWGVEGYPTLIGVFDQTIKQLPGYVFELKDGIAFVFPAN